ncbi:helix-turn-helix transcriptional regulator [Brooklawnia cerclae]|uniref:DNA-binding transcriptional ArsR family regulator n=1 Tax=Brooklawnia cerclae TaxID=349934 RepID=A0ABX0SHD7_9ACTN|nr:DNA-binding transcriptional ArsR family regulator [Brooklawnia cerclae]
MRELEHPEIDDIRIDAVLAALADPVRRSIVTELAAGNHDMVCSAFDLPVTNSTKTHHFRVLREAGIIRQEYRGTSIHNSLRIDDLDARFPGLLSAILTAD